MHEAGNLDKILVNLRRRRRRLVSKLWPWCRYCRAGIKVFSFTSCQQQVASKTVAIRGRLVHVKRLCCCADLGSFRESIKYGSWNDLWRFPDAGPATSAPVYADAPVLPEPGDIKHIRWFPYMPDRLQFLALSRSDLTVYNRTQK